MNSLDVFGSYGLIGTWKELLQNELEAPYFQGLQLFLEEELAKHTVFPAIERVFAAFHLTPFESVKVVVLGQDPYHGKGQANGLCFSVTEGIRKPPSLQNIFKELESDLNIPIPSHGSLEEWAKQGVLLLNATLTVREGEAGSHQLKGWEQFTDAVISSLSANHEGLVFLLWGNFAKKKAALIDGGRHHILTAAHPSPLARTGFKGCKHFSQTNKLLTQMGMKTINWHIG
jgi:uracil-DNA glycosylase